MNKEDVIRHLTRTMLDGKQARFAVDRIFEIIKHGVRRDGKVVISNFGTFHLRELRAGLRRNPKTGEKVQMPARQKVHFKASKHILRR